MNSAHVTGKEANWFANWRISIVWLAPENQQLAAITNYHHWYLNQFTVAHGPTLCATLTVAVQAASKTPELGWLGAMAGGWKRWSSNHDLSQSQSQSFESMWNCCIMLYRHKWYSLYLMIFLHVSTPEVYSWLPRIGFHHFRNDMEMGTKTPAGIPWIPALFTPCFSCITPQIITKIDKLL